MPDNDQNDKLDLSRRKILAATGAVGATGLGAGFGANALFSGQELFANNRIEAGELDLKVDWEVDYFNGLDPDPVTISDSDIDGDGDLELVDDPGPIVDLQDVKPGDVIQHTLSLHLFGNPGFITMDGLLTADSDNGFTEPEDQVDGALNDSDGTPDGDLDNHLQCVVWFDDGDGLPQEIWSTSYSQTDAFIQDLIDGNVSFDTNADEFLFQGTLASLMGTLSGGLLLDPRVNDNAADTYSDSFCYQPSTTEYVSVLCWLPRDIPGVDDDIVQSDRLQYELGFNANQCRNNIANDGRPVQRPTGGVRPLTFEVSEGYGTLDGGPVDLESDVGFPGDMVTNVDTSGDPVEFVLDPPQELDKSAGDQWSLVFDADDDGTVDFRVVFDEFFYQEWDDDQGEWGREQSVPSDIDTAVVDGIYVVRVPRDRLSDPFAFAGRLCYRDPPEVSGFRSDEDLCVGLTPDLVPRDEPGRHTSDFEEIALLSPTQMVKGACCVKDGRKVPEIQEHTCKLVRGTAEDQGSRSANKNEARRIARKKCDDFCKNKIRGAQPSDCTFVEGAFCYPREGMGMGPANPPEITGISLDDDCGDDSCCGELDFTVDSPVPIYAVQIEAIGCDKTAKQRDTSTYRTSKADDKEKFGLRDLLDEGETVCLEKCQKVRVKVIPEHPNAQKSQPASCAEEYDNKTHVYAHKVKSKDFSSEDGCGVCCLVSNTEPQRVYCVPSESEECCRQKAKERGSRAYAWVEDGDCEDSDDEIPDACEQARGDYKRPGRAE